MLDGKKKLLRMCPYFQKARHCAQRIATHPRRPRRQDVRENDLMRVPRLFCFVCVCAFQSFQVWVRLSKKMCSFFKHRTHTVTSQIQHASCLVVRDTVSITLCLTLVRLHSPAFYFPKSDLFEG